MDLSLDPTFEPYRPLTNADIKLLTFITCIGTTFKIKDLSSQLNLHRNTVVKLLSEYHQNQLIQRVLQFNNIGLELPIYFYLKVPKKIDFPFVEQCRTLTCLDVFIATEKQSNIYFGKVDIPLHWARDFTVRMKAIRETYPDVKLQYSMEPSVLAKWNLSLKETYDC